MDAAGVVGWGSHDERAVQSRFFFPTKVASTILPVALFTKGGYGRAPLCLATTSAAQTVGESDGVLGRVGMARPPPPCGAGCHGCPRRLRAGGAGRQPAPGGRTRSRACTPLLPLPSGQHTGTRSNRRGRAGRTTARPRQTRMDDIKWSIHTTKRERGNLPQTRATAKRAETGATDLTSHPPCTPLPPHTAGCSTFPAALARPRVGTAWKKYGGGGGDDEGRRVHRWASPATSAPAHGRRTRGRTPLKQWQQGKRREHTVS